MDKFEEAHKVSKLTPKDVRNLNTTLRSKDIESVTTKTANRGDPGTRQLRL